jgi:phosphopantothenoylcysteine synthetase/decarboxylase
MRAIVTCGPSSEPIDEVRRLTNFSTGELGTLLSAALVRAGIETVCLRGIAATWPERPAGADLRPFLTNDDLRRELQQLASTASWDAVFHCAALADFRVIALRGSSGSALNLPKISSYEPRLTIELEPAVKLLPQLRAWFPSARLIGWKYELNGTREDAVATASRQIEQYHTDACVLNGRAYGSGFAIITRDGTLTPVESKETLCHHLIRTFLSIPQKPLASSAG